MADIISLQELADAKLDAQSLERFINGGVDEEVLTRLSQQYPTIKKLLLEFQKYNGRAYSTLAAANADIANIALNTKVSVLSETDGGDYYKATSDATSLTKSAYDPLAQAREYTDEKLTTRLTTLTSLNTLEAGNYFITQADLFTISNAGNLANLGYPAEIIVGMGGAKINVVRSSTTLYQSLEMTRQGVGFYRQGAGSVGEFFPWVSNVSAAILEANKNPKFNPDQRSVGVITDISTSDSSKTSIFEYQEGIYNIPRTTVNTYADKPEDASLLLTVNNVVTGVGNYTKFEAQTTTGKTFVAYKNYQDVITPWELLVTSSVVSSQISSYDTSLKDANPVLKPDSRKMATVTAVALPDSRRSILEFSEGLWNIARTMVATITDAPPAPAGSIFLECDQISTVDGGWNFYTARCVDGRTYTRWAKGSAWQEAEWRVIASTSDIADALSNISAVKSDPDNCVIGLGSSSMSLMESKLRELVRAKGHEYIGGGFSGTSAQTMAMFCGYGTYFLNFANDTVLQNDVAVDITFSNAADFGTNASNPTGTTAGWWITLENGVRGQINIANSEFTPRNLSENLIVSGAVKVLPNLARYKRSIAIIQTGKNNFTSNPNSTHIANIKNSFDEVVRQIEAVQQDARYIILGHHINRDTNETYRNAVTEVNSYLKDKYKNRYLDLQAWLSSSQLWSDLEITPTQIDLDAQALGWLPPSISSDNAHLNIATSDYFVEHFIIPKLESMGYI